MRYLLLSALVLAGCGLTDAPGPAAPTVPLVVTVTRDGKPHPVVTGERFELTLTSASDGGRYTLPAGPRPGVYSAPPKGPVPVGKYMAELTIDNPGGKPGMPRTVRFSGDLDVGADRPEVALDLATAR